MTEKHLSSQFEADLNTISAHLLEMGGLVEAQVANAMKAFSTMDAELASEVLAKEKAVNDFEINIDKECAEILARRQPTAKDLRLVLAIAKAISNLERVGDEADHIAARIKKIAEVNAPYQINVAEIRIAGQMALGLLRRSLDAFARMDSKAAATIVADDLEIDNEFRGFVRKLNSYMSEDPRIISTALEILFIAKAVERIGDHAKNISEFVIYVDKGMDVRHLPHEQLIQEANK
ncbi:phosphate transport system regulatory protein PhoU [Polynucleobacter sp. SHI8]|uniref:phosphate signaling complex protein PhoU n=1 Tax=unclassified Polynucleobacter TaxID=2640945 RepID=UPI002490D703|nr:MULTISPECIES: phosphate signaling complex protein PhoU [unclassified Polynucleobacter]BDW10607.1 phosphate transport system regulatory protein PhoU [Polynucleobacter sp. SHI2]BDW13053.1 phosphate transport system regulatory protein PhoU [Polynucleobacter sp. SHI8]